MKLFQVRRILAYAVIIFMLKLPVVAWGQTSYAVTNFAQLQARISDYNMAVSDIVVIIEEDFDITSLLSLTNSNNATLTIKSDATTRTLTRGVVGDLFTVGSGASLILEDII